MNDLPLHVNSDLDMYRDYSTVGASGKTVRDIENKLNSEISEVTKWCSQNKMVINTSKTESMLITTKQRRKHLKKSHLNVVVNSDQLEHTIEEVVSWVCIDTR